MTIWFRLPTNKIKEISMAEAIRDFTPQRDAREELRRRIEAAPMDHAEALLSAYKLLQAAHDHGATDLLRGAIGASDAIIGKASEFANTPEGTRALRNLLALVRLLGEIDPTLLDAAAEALSRSRRERDLQPPSVIGAIRGLVTPESRRAFGKLSEIMSSFGAALDRSESGNDGRERFSSMASGAAIPLTFSAAVLMVLGFWMLRRER
jgi:uncharacterized protein YjgD (DUF1641 family)